MESRSDQDRWQKHAENKRVPSLHYQQHHSRNDVGGSTNETKAPVDKEKLRAMFYPDSDSDDDPIESIKRRQIAANKRKRELAEANAISKDVGLKRAAVTDNSIQNISSNNEKANENTTFPKRHCTTPQNATITNEGIEPKYAVCFPPTHRLLVESVCCAFPFLGQIDRRLLFLLFVVAVGHAFLIQRRIW